MRLGHGRYTDMTRSSDVPGQDVKIVKHPLECSKIKMKKSHYTNHALMQMCFFFFNVTYANVL